jgi:mono/diheme cytochrome c family protein
MKIKIGSALLVLTFASLAADTNNSVQPQSPSYTPAQIQRGQYLVEHVAMCADCHTPKTDAGAYDRSQWLLGDMVDIKPVEKRPFALVAPMIAGLPNFPTDAQALKFFITGTNEVGKLALAPMPQFRFNQEDATAVVAYLRSLKH